MIAMAQWTKKTQSTRSPPISTQTEMDSEMRTLRSHPAKYPLAMWTTAPTAMTTMQSNTPGADEYCNEEDDDCDGAIDEEDAVDPSVWYADAMPMDMETRKTRPKPAGLPQATPIRPTIVMTRRRTFIPMRKKCVMVKTPIATR